MTDNIQFQELPKKQQQLLNTATELFCKHGVRRVTIEEICKSADISKMTFYKYFDNKWDIAHRVLQLLAMEELRFYHTIVEDETPFPQKVENILKLSLARVHSVGIGQAFVDDLKHPESPLFAYFTDQQKKSRELAVEFFEHARQEGLIHPEIRMPVLLFMLNRLSDLLNHPEFVAIMPNVEDRIHELASIFFHGFARAQNSAPG